MSVTNIFLIVIIATSLLFLVRSFVLFYIRTSDTIKVTRKSDGKSVILHKKIDKKEVKKLLELLEH